MHRNARIEGKPAGAKSVRDFRSSSGFAADDAPGKGARAKKNRLFTQSDKRRMVEDAATYLAQRHGDTEDSSSDGVL